jgi:hypothetical protein
MYSRLSVSRTFDEERLSPPPPPFLSPPPPFFFPPPFFAADSCIVRPRGHEVAPRAALAANAGTRPIWEMPSGLPAWCAQRRRACERAARGLRPTERGVGGVEWGVGEGGRARERERAGSRRTGREPRENASVCAVSAARAAAESSVLRMLGETGGRTCGRALFVSEVCSQC